MTDLEAIKQAVIQGNRKEITGLVQAALDNGADPQVIINDYMIEAMKEVGARFECKKIFVPEMMIAARTMQTGLDIIKPLLEVKGVQKEKRGTVVIGTVFGDLHDIGKNLVVLMMESSGFEVINIGENVSPETFVSKARELKADVVGLSSLLTTGDQYVKATVRALKDSGLNGLKVICGGAAVTRKFAIEACGADGYAADAVGAVRLVNDLLGLAA
ncbi:MAG: B12-binding domain-containing protein [Desulfobaccales bacterium]